MQLELYFFKSKTEDQKKYNRRILKLRASILEAFARLEGSHQGQAESGTIDNEGKYSRLKRIKPQ